MFKRHFTWQNLRQSLKFYWMTVVLTYVWCAWMYYPLAWQLCVTQHVICCVQRLSNGAIEPDSEVARLVELQNTVDKQVRLSLCLASVVIHSSLTQTISICTHNMSFCLFGSLMDHTFIIVVKKTNSTSKKFRTNSSVNSGSRLNCFA